MEQDKHIVKSYDDEMKEINNNILDIGSLVEDQLKRALIALKNQDSQLAERVTEDDNLIDEKFRELDQNLVLILGKRQPMATDLRTIFSAIKMNKDLERLGDHVRESAVVFVKLCYSGLFIAILVALIILSNLALNSPWGRKVRAIRDNEVAASAMGKDIKKQHLQIFVLGSAIVGIAGALLVTYDGIFIPTGYVPLRFTFLIWVMVILGGSGNNMGSVLGAFIIWFIWIQSGPIGLWVVERLGDSMLEGSNSLEFIEDRVHYLRLVFMGAILLVIMRFSPSGLLPEKNKEL